MFFSAFYGQRSVAEAWTNPSLLSIVNIFSHNKMFIKFFAEYQKYSNIHDSKNASNVVAKEREENSSESFPLCDFEPVYKGFIPPWDKLRQMHNKHIEDTNQAYFLIIVQDLTNLKEAPTVIRGVG